MMRITAASIAALIALAGLTGCNDTTTTPPETTVSATADLPTPEPMPSDTAELGDMTGGDR